MFSRVVEEDWFKLNNLFDFLGEKVTRNYKIVKFSLLKILVTSLPQLNYSSISAFPSPVLPPHTSSRGKSSTNGRIKGLLL